jgi:hypothetical protein
MVAFSGVTLKDVCDVVDTAMAELSVCVTAFVAGDRLEAKLPKTAIEVVSVVEVCLGMLNVNRRVLPVVKNDVLAGPPADPEL